MQVRAKEKLFYRGALVPKGKEFNLVDPKHFNKTLHEDASKPLAKTGNVPPLPTMEPLDGEGRPTGPSVAQAQAQGGGIVAGLKSLLGVSEKDGAGNGGDGGATGSQKKI